MGRHLQRMCDKRWWRQFQFLAHWQSAQNVLLEHQNSLGLRGKNDIGNGTFYLCCQLTDAVLDVSCCIAVLPDGYHKIQLEHDHFKCLWNLVKEQFETPASLHTHYGFTSATWLSKPSCFDLILLMFVEKNAQRWGVTSSISTIQVWKFGLKWNS